MKSVDLNIVSYKHRSAAASLLISKANRLSGIGSLRDRAAADDKTLLAAVAYYDMALVLLKPFDPNYSTVAHWKCLALLALRQYEQAVAWYREIVRLSDETDGKATRNATAALAERMIVEYDGRRDEPLSMANLDTTTFDDPAYCIVAEDFCLLLSQGKFKKAHAYLSPALRETMSVATLKEEWRRTTQGTTAADLTVTLQQHLVDWPGRRTEEVGWCYYGLTAEALNEAVIVVVGRMPNNAYMLTQVGFGRP